MTGSKKNYWFIRCAAVGALIVSMGFSSFASERYRDVDLQQKVYDYADLLTPEQEDTLKEMCQDIIEENGYDVFLLTIDDNTLEYESQDRTLSFVEDFGDENGFGLGEDKDYVAFIIDMDERNYNIDVVGNRCLHIFSTEIQEGIKDDVESYMKNGSYYQTMKYFLNEVEACGSKEVSSFVGSEEDWQKYKQGKSIWKVVTAMLQALIIAVIAGGIAVFIASQKHKSVKKAVSANIYSDESSFKVTNSKEMFLRHYATTRTIESSHGGGDSSGGSHHTSTHTSSSGGSHGGGSSRGF